MAAVRDLREDPDFFGPLKDVPLHIVFRVIKQTPTPQLIEPDSPTGHSSAFLVFSTVIGVMIGAVATLATPF